jgi:sigma-B regulation protein RsbU (phosphoserine phosphatase)
MHLIDIPDDILIVDDSPANLRLLSQILSKRGYHVRAVTSGLRALASIDIHLPDLILLDIRMPEMDGYELCQQLKTNPRSKDIPILFISALDDIQDKVKAFETGGVDYITKPFQLEEVIARVETHLSIRKLQRNLEEANRRMESEMSLAAKVQASFMHKSLPAVPGLHLSVSLIPAQLTSGDFYDIFQLPGNSLGIVIADVVDKGVGAALYMAMSIALLRAYSMEHLEHPEQVCQAVNQRLLEYAGANHFVTVFYGIFDPKSGNLVYCNAGHPPPLLLSPSKPSAYDWLKNTGVPLGVIEDATWQQANTQLSPGDTLVLFTDGIIEAESADHQFYGLEKLVNTTKEHVGKPAAVIRDIVLESVNEFTVGTTLADDIALIVLVRD